MQRRIVAAMVLFSVATWMLVRLGDWLSAPLVGPIGGLMVAGLGAFLIGLAPNPVTPVQESPDSAAEETGGAQASEGD